MYEYRGGLWQKLELEPAPETLDKAIYGAASMDELAASLADTGGALNFSFQQISAVMVAWPEVLNGAQKRAIKLAGTCPNPALAERLYRGAILGAMLANMQDGGGNREVLKELIVAEIDKYGHPARNAILKKAGASSPDFGLFLNAVATDGMFSDLLSGNLDRETARLW